MARRVDHTEVLRLSRKTHGRRINCNAPFPLFLVSIQQVSKLESSFTTLFSNFCSFMHDLLVDFAKSIEQMAGQSRLTSIDMAYNDHVDSSFHCILIDSAVVLHLRMGCVQCLMIQDVVHHGGLRVDLSTVINTYSVEGLLFGSVLFFGCFSLLFGLLGSFFFPPLFGFVLLLFHNVSFASRFLLRFLFG